MVDSANRIMDRIRRRKYKGLNDLDKKMEKYVDFDNGFFVEVGGADGINQSNSYYFEMYRGWTGVLIEPAPNQFLECVRNRPGSQVFCYACVPFDYPHEFVRMSYSALMTLCHSDAHAASDISDLTEHASSGARLQGTTTFDFGAVAKPISNILSDGDIERDIDFMSLDVEGFELPLLRGMDLERHRPRYICVESRSFEDIKGYLEGNEYVFLEQLSYHDYLFADSRRRSK